MMPFACHSERGEVKLSTANETSYRILGRRDEQPFVKCRGGGACTTLMVHRFTIDCEGEKATWAKVASAARALGVDVPGNLPSGYAPVSSLAGRFVFPALAPTGPHLTQVAMQDLSPNSVIDENDDSVSSHTPGWVTVVNADMRPDAQGGALRVGGAVGSLLVFLFGAGMVAAGRWRLPALAVADLPGVASAFKSRLAEQAQALTALLRQRATDASHAWNQSVETDADEGLANAMAMVHARLAETELVVATLGPDLLLRDVLQSEIDRVRERADTTAKQLRRTSTQRSAVGIRTMLRELERISRIAQSAVRGPAVRDVREDAEPPRSVFEAYQVLGINADAAPAVAKKLVDALRMSWHPDHARDEPDRLRREERMKQINIAWDLISGRREAA